MPSSINGARAFLGDVLKASGAAVGSTAIGALIREVIALGRGMIARPLLRRQIPT